MTDQTSPYYSIQHLKPNLVLIRWFRTPPMGSPVVRAWRENIMDLLDNATEMVYFISDLRVASVMDVNAIRETVNIMREHPNYGGGTSFSQKTSSALYANLFARLSRREQPSAESLAASLMILEDLHPGITKDIDWKAALQESLQDSNEP